MDFKFNKNIWLVVLILFYITVLSQQVIAGDEITVDAYLDEDKVVIGETLNLTISVKGTRSSDRPQIPKMEAFKFEYTGTSTQFSIINGVTSFSVEFNYRLIPLKVGEHTIPPISVEIGGKEYQSKPITVEVLQGTSSGQRTEFDDMVFLTLSIDKTEVYLNEEIPVTIRLYVANGVSARVGIPELILKGFSISEFERSQEKQEMRNGVYYNFVEYTTRVYPVTSGLLTLGPANLECQVQVRSRSRSSSGWPFDDSFFDDFFGNYATYDLNLESEPIDIRVKPLPENGKPESFSGAVGRFDMNVKVDSSEVNVGDALTIKIDITGQGNMKMISGPRLLNEDGFKIYAPQVKQGNGYDSMTFERIIIPMDTSIKEIPAFEFSYFDPEEETYRTIVRGPFPLKVRGIPQNNPPLNLGVEEDLHAQEDIAYIKVSSGFFRSIGSHVYNDHSFLGINALSLMGFVSAILYRRRKVHYIQKEDLIERRHAPKRFKEELIEAKRSMEAGQIDEFYTSIVGAVRDYLSKRFQVSPSQIDSGISYTLRDKGVSEKYLEKIEKFFATCDAMRFSVSSEKKDVAKSVLKMAEDLLE